MQRTRTVVLVIGALGLLVGCAMLAQTSQQPPEGRRGRGRAPMSVDERLQRMSERLNLTDEQKEKIRPILQDQANQLKALREDTSLSPAQRREKRRKIGQATRKQIAQILTPEQKEKWREMGPGGRGRRQGRPEGPPQS